MVKKMQFKPDISCLLAPLLFLLLFSSAFATTPITIAHIEPPTQHDLIFQYQSNGVVKVTGDSDAVLTRIGFILVGTYDGTTYVKKSTDFDWSWQQDVNAEDGSLLDSYTGSNGGAVIDWNQTWNNNVEEGFIGAKITHNLKFPVDVDNTKLFFVLTIPNERKIKYNNNEYSLENVSDIHITENLDSILPNLEIDTNWSFGFQDLIDSGYKISDLYVDDGTGLPAAAGLPILTGSKYIIIGIGPYDLKANTLYTLDPSVTTVDASATEPDQIGLALESGAGENPHISYRSGFKLYHAYYDGSSWTTEEVDAATYTETYSAIDLNSSDDPQIVYYTNGSADDLNFASSNGDWNFTTIDTNGDTGLYPSIALDSDDNIYVSYFDTTADDLKYAHYNSFTKVWSIEPVDMTGSVGYTTSIALDVNNNPHISYYDYSNTNLKHAYWTGSDWNIETVDASGDTGYFTSIAIDDNNNIHISYRSPGGHSLKYAKYNSATSTWSIETVHSPGSTSENFGLGNSIALDSSNNPHITYREHGYGSLRYAVYDGSEWNLHTLDTVGSVGQYNQIAIDSDDNVHIAYYDSTNDDLKYIFIEGTNNAPDVNIAKIGGNLDSQGLPYFTYEADGNLTIDFNVQDDDNGELYATLWYSETTTEHTVELDAFVIVEDLNLNSAGVCDDIDFTDATGCSWDLNISGKSLAVGHTLRDTNFNILVRVTDRGASDFNASDNNLSMGSWAGYTEIVDTSAGRPEANGYDIAFDSSNYPHIAYEKSAHLYYASYDGSSWTKTEIDAGGGIDCYGIAIDSSDHPKIVYYTGGASDDLNFADYNGSDWNFTRIDTNGNTGLYTKIALDSSNNIYVSYYDTTADDLKYAYSAAGSNVWSVEVVDITGSVGLYSSIALDSSNNPHIAYMDWTNKDLKHAYWTGSDWNVATIYASGNVGYYPSIAIDSSDDIHISHYDDTGDDLEYAKYDAGTATWSFTTIDSTGNVGAPASLALDASENPHISYHDDTKWNLKYAAYTGSDWNTGTIDFSNYAGYSVIALAIDSNNTAHIAYHDWDLYYLKYTTIWFGGSANTAPDLNIWQAIQYDVNYPFSGGILTWFGDQNITIDFNVFDPDNDRLTVDINYNTEAETGTPGIPIITDLNLTSAVCSDQDWADSPSLCKWDWNGAVADGNYYIIIEIDDGTDTDFNISDSNIGIDASQPTTLNNDFNNTWQNTDANIQFSCSDVNAGCKNFYYGLNDVNYQFGWGGDLNIGIVLDYDYNHEIWFWSGDVVDNNEAPQLIHLAIDKEVPTLKATDYNNLWQNTDANILIECNDVNGGCKNLYYSIGDDNYQKKWSPDLNLGIEVTTDGNWHIWYWADDNTTGIGDNNSTPTHFYIAIDKTVPTLKATDYNNLWQNTDANILISCEDVNGGCKNLYYGIEGDANYQKKWSPDLNLGIEVTTDGNWHIWYWADDNTTGIGDNNSTPTHFYIAIDKTAPTTTDNDYNNTWQNTDANIQFSCSDSSGGDQNAGCRNFYYSLDDTNYQLGWGIDQNIGIEITWDGNHEIFYWSDDNTTGVGDNNEQAHLIYLEIDKSAPTTLATDYNNLWQNTDANILLSCSDVNGGCKNLYYSLDDVNYQLAWNPDQNIGIELTTDANHLIFYWSDNNTTGAGDNNETAKFFYLAIDKTAPTTPNITSPTEVINTTYILTYLASTDATSGIKEYQVRTYLGNPITNQLNLSYSFALDADERMPTQKTYCTKAVDNADNTAETCINATLRRGGTGWLGQRGTTKPAETKQILILEKEFVPLAEADIPVLDQTEKQLELRQKRFATADDIRFGRGLKEQQLLRLGNIFGYRCEITIFIENITDKTLTRVELVEEIPKEMVENAAFVESDSNFFVIEADPMLKFLVGDIKSGEKAEITYWFERSREQGPVTEEMFNRMKAPIVLIKLEEGDLCMGVYCNDLDACTRDYCKKGECRFVPMQERAKCATDKVCIEGKCAAVGEKEPETLPEKMAQFAVPITVAGIIVAALIILLAAITITKRKKQGKKNAKRMQKRA